MTPHKNYILSIFIIKLLFGFFAVFHIYYKIKGTADSEQDKRVVFWKERLEFVFIILMSALLIYMFNPLFTKKKVSIKGETKILMFLFGIVLLLGAKWDIFIHESPFFQTV